MSKAKQKTQADIDWENRTLCSDESCIGVIGPDGRCKECGKISEGYTPPPTESVEVDPEPLQEEEVSSVDETEASDTAEVNFDDSWENRTLCSDESCIGVIGPDGRCKECGKPYTSN